MRILGALAIAASFTICASAQDSYEVASQLGSVLGSEEACNLQFDQAAIAQFIEDHVAADDMDFATSLQGRMSLEEYLLENMKASAMTAHCAQITRVAKSYNFIE